MRTKIRTALEKFPLELKDGAKVMTMYDLRANFDLNKIIAYFENGTLERWLRDRFYEDEANALKNISSNDKDFVEKLCKILCIDELLEVAEWRKARREKLAKFTDDAEIFQNIDDVAFNQDELEDILREENIPPKIYLCDKIFRFPSGILKKKNICYVGIGKVTVVVESSNEFDLKALGITLENVSVDRTRGYFVFSNVKVTENKTTQTKTTALEVNDLDRAKNLFIKAENYYYGRNRFSKDRMRAFTLYYQAAALGSTRAKERLELLFNYKN